jgi:membrane protein DedA with SNARE-associated domain
MLSEDSAIVTGVLLALHGIVPAWAAVLSCFLGMWSSDFAVYLLLKTGGARALDSRWDLALVSQKKVESASSWVTRFGGFALVFSRLVLGTRTALLVVSGTRYPPSGSSGLITARTNRIAEKFLRVNATKLPMSEASTGTPRFR